MPRAFLWGWRHFYFESKKRKRFYIMEIELYVGNLSKLTTHSDLRFLFSQAGKVTEAILSMDGKSGEPKGFAFVTMSAQSEADKAVNMFNGYSLFEHELKVHLFKPRQQRGLTDPVYKP
jgi:RNA recognition motif-containing protein